MASITMTKRAVDGAGAGRHYDTKLPGFGLYVGANGTRSYFFEYRPGRGRGVAKRRLAIGRHGAPWTPERAREKALEYLAAVKAGRDPLAEREAATQAVATTVTAAVEEWLRRDQATNRSHREVERIMRREVLPAWGGRDIREIRKRDVIALVEGIADRGAPIMANRTLAHVKRLFRWSAGRDLIEIDPAAHVERPAAEVKRDRVLSDAELVHVWNAAGAMGLPFGAAVQLLILTGARRDEVLALTWREVDLDGASIRLPAERSKSKEGRAIPMPPAALGLLAGLPRLAGGEYVFSFDGRRPYANSSHAKARLDRLIKEACGERPAPWRLHDLRRTVATGLQRLGVPLEVTETVLGHLSGSRAGIVGVYQRHTYSEEARAALTRWARHVEGLLSGEAARGEAARVVPLPRSA